MSWTEFLQKIVDRQPRNFGPDTEARFIKIFSLEDSNQYRINTQSVLAKKFGYEIHEPFGRYLTDIYEALKPLFLEDGFVLRPKPGKGRSAGNETQLYRVHKWLRDRYDKDQAIRERENQAIDALHTTERRLHELLKEFSYSEEQGQFCKAVNTARCSAFLIRVDGQATQQWLARRLAEKIPNFPSSKRITIDLRNQFIAADLFTELARGILENRPGNDPDDVIREVAQFCKTQNLTIALYGIGALESADWDSLQGFWEKLVNLVDQGKCTLLLTEEADFDGPIALTKNDPAPWKTVEPLEWETWVDRQEVQELWASCPRSDTDRPFKGIPPGKPQQALERICKEFSVNGPVIKVMTDKIWNLAA
jgi:inactive STAND